MPKTTLTFLRVYTVPEDLVVSVSFSSIMPEIVVSKIKEVIIFMHHLLDHVDKYEYLLLIVLH